MLVGLFAATHSGTGWIGEWVLFDVLYAVGVALVVGAAGGWLLAAAIARLQARDLFSRDLDGFFAPATALVVYGAAEALGTLGCLPYSRPGSRSAATNSTMRSTRAFITALRPPGACSSSQWLLLLGSTLTITGLRIPGVAGWLLAPPIILLIRPVLVLAVTDRAFLDLHGRLFLGFFGVRGVAALYYVTIVAGSTDLSHTAASKVVWTTVVCVAISITVHGITATPLTRRLLG